MNAPKKFEHIGFLVFISICLFAGGYTAGYLGLDKRSSGTGQTYSYQISRVLELERAYAGRERSRLEAEGSRLRAENGRITAERDRLTRERSLASADRADLKRLAEIFDKIGELSEVHK